jgi:hypothetical protein
MKCLECKNYVKNEVTPIITDIILNWIDSERYEDWFENTDDIEEFSEMELPEEIKDTILREVNNSIADCFDDYDYDDPTFNEEDLFMLAETIWVKEKNKYVDKLYDLFDRENFDEYNEDEDYGGTAYDF